MFRMLNDVSPDFIMGNMTDDTNRARDGYPPVATEFKSGFSGIMLLTFHLSVCLSVCIVLCGVFVCHFVPCLYNYEFFLLSIVVSVKGRGDAAGYISGVPFFQSD